MSLSLKTKTPTSALRVRKRSAFYYRVKATSIEFNAQSRVKRLALLAKPRSNASLTDSLVCLVRMAFWSRVTIL